MDRDPETEPCPIMQCQHMRRDGRQCEFNAERQDTLCPFHVRERAEGRA